MGMATGWGVGATLREEAAWYRGQTMHAERHHTRRQDNVIQNEWIDEKIGNRNEKQ